MEILTNLRDDALKRMLDSLSELIAASETIKHEEENIRRFSEHMIFVRHILSRQQSQLSESGFAQSSTASHLLCSMESAVNSARKAIEGYRSKNPLLSFWFSRSVLSQLNRSSNEIAKALSLLPLAQINTSLGINSIVDVLIHSLKSMAPKLEANSAAIHSMLDLYVSESGENRQQADALAVTSSCVSPSQALIQVQEEGINEAYQFTQMLQCYTGDVTQIIASSPFQNERYLDEVASPPSIFFFCPLTLKIMEDPVNVSCYHSYERKAIEEYFNSGEKLCRLCKKELSSSSGKLESTPNSTLLSAITEWNQRNARVKAEKSAKMKLRDAADRIVLDNLESTNGALEDLKAVMMEMPSCISEATESSCKLIPKLAELLKKGKGNTSSVLQCIFLIARLSDENKEIIGSRGVIKCLLKQSNIERTAIEILLELSTNSVSSQKIIETKNSIHILVSLLDNPNSRLACSVLQNLSTSINNTLLMAKSGYINPFLDYFNSQGISDETRVFMAEELSQIELTKTAAKNIKNNELFIAHLTVMLSCCFPASQMASLKCIKRLIIFDELRDSFLSTISTVAALLCLIFDTATEHQPKEEGFDILISLVETSPPFDQQSAMKPGLQRLYSVGTILSLLQQIEADNQISPSKLLLAMLGKSEAARDRMISDPKVMCCLFSALIRDPNALKLIHCITAGKRCPCEMPLPQEAALCSVIAILIGSSSEEEVSAAANIISHLPGDRSTDLALQNSYVLKAIHALISHANNSDEFVENGLGALLRCMSGSDHGFQMKVSKLVRILVQLLSSGSPLAKQRSAMILVQLSRCAPVSSSSSWPNLFPVKRATCLVRDGALEPLVKMIDSVNSATSEAALMALDTLFDADADAAASAEAARAIVGSNGAASILKAMERGPASLKKAALELFENIYRHPDITSKELITFRGMLVYLLSEEDELKRKARLLLAELQV